MMKRALSGGLIAAFASACASAPTAPPAPSPPVVSIFTVAHQDDWQLFMNPEAYHGMDEPQEKAVFIHVTAGDAGAGAGGEPVPYYLAREEGALRAVRFMANAADPSIGKGARMDSAQVERGGHGVQRYAYANAVVYFLRLPDGNIVNGSVYTPHPESLTRLRSGDAATSGTVEQSGRYEGWQDRKRLRISSHRIFSCSSARRLPTQRWMPKPKLRCWRGRGAVDDELVGVLDGGLVAVARQVPHHDLVALADLLAAQLGILPARCGACAPAASASG
jgi:hypothetical protein